ncbi:MAG: ABC transporter permease [Bryobacteraceae bacterium]
MLADLRFAVRLLTRRPAFAIIAIFTLALGIGVNTLMFSVADHVLFRAFPYKDPERLVYVHKLHPEHGRVMSSPNYLATWKSRADVFEDVGAWTFAGFNLFTQSIPDSIRGARASASLFTMLGVQPQHGRLFAAGDEKPGSDQIVLLSDRLWRGRFNADPAIVGSSLMIGRNGEPAAEYTVVGVLPPSFDAAFRSHGDLWSPLAPGRNDRGNWWVIGRLKPGLGTAQAATSLRDAFLDPFHEYLTRHYRDLILSLFGAVVFVLLIACVNLANLLLVEASERQREIAIRAATGASRSKLFRLLITEGLLISALGSVAGVLLVVWGIPVVKTIIPSGLFRAESIAVDGRVLLFTIAATVLTTLLIGLVPSLKASQVDLTAALRTSPGSAASHRRWRSALVVTEVAMGFILLTGSALMINSFLRALHVELGFVAENLVSMKTYLPQPRYPSPADRLRLIDQLLAGAETVAGVRSVAITDCRPMGDAMRVHVAKPSATGSPMRSWRELIAGDYFKAMGTRMLRGRSFTPRDDAGAVPVAVVNDTLARRLWPGEDPIGKTISIAPISSGKWQTREIVGLIADVHRFGPVSEAGASIYIPQAQEASNHLDLVIRIEPAGASPAVRQAIRSHLHSLDPRLTFDRVTEVPAQAAAYLDTPRFLTVLLSVFGFLALVLTAGGIYGVMAYLVRLRAHEIGVRLAVGAQKRDILRLILGYGGRLTLIGMLVGIAGAIAATRVLSTALFQIKPNDAVTYGVAAAVLALVALAATLAPARRALAVDPVVALRAE